jgi:hypothetical protein
VIAQSIQACKVNNQDVSLGFFTGVGAREMRSDGKKTKWKQDMAPAA